MKWILFIGVGQKWREHIFHTCGHFGWKFLNGCRLSSISPQPTEIKAWFTDTELLVSNPHTVYRLERAAASSARLHGAL